MSISLLLRQGYVCEFGSIDFNSEACMEISVPSAIMPKMHNCNLLLKKL